MWISWRNYLGYSVFFAAWFVRRAGKLLKSEWDSRIAMVWLFFRSMLLAQFDDLDMAYVLELPPPLASEGAAEATADGSNRVGNTGPRDFGKQ